MVIQDLPANLTQDEYLALLSIDGFDKLPAQTPVAGLTRNGNYCILYLNDGSKLRFGTGDSLEPNMPECIDCTITHKCNGGCEFCYMSCNADGEHAVIKEGPARKIIDQIQPCTELAINGNDLTHPDLDWFLQYMKERKVFVNVTVNQRHFLESFHRIMDWKSRDLIRGIGVSYTDPSPELLTALRSASDSVVVHLIAGIVKSSDLNYLAYNDLNILILGFKTIGRGASFVQSPRNFNMITGRMEILERILSRSIWDSRRFKSIAFDGLAIKQLRVKDWLGEKLYNEIYAGDEGAYTFYLDLVDMVYQKSSIEHDPIPCGDKSIYEMFNSIRTEPLRIN